VPIYLDCYFTSGALTYLCLKLMTGKPARLGLTLYSASMPIKIITSQGGWFLCLVSFCCNTYIWISQCCYTFYLLPFWLKDRFHWIKFYGVYLITDADDYWMSECKNRKTRAFNVLWMCYLACFLHVLQVLCLYIHNVHGTCVLFTSIICANLHSPILLESSSKRILIYYFE